MQSFGEIAKAYLLAAKTGKKPEDFFGLRTTGQGRGQIIRGSGMKPNELAPGQILKGKKGNIAVATATATPDDDATPGVDQGTPDNHQGKDNGNSGKGQGNGNDDNNGNKGNGNGNGSGNGNGGGNGKGKK